MLNIICFFLLFIFHCSIFTYFIVNTDIKDSAFPFLIGLFSVGATFILSILLIALASARENRKYIIRTAASFCDELMKDSGKFWMSKCCEGNKIEMGMLRCEIGSSINLIEKHLKNNFSNYENNSKIKDALQIVKGHVGGKCFELSDRNPNVEKANLSIDSIVQLRLIISKQKNPGLKDLVRDLL